MGTWGQRRISRDWATGSLITMISTLRLLPETRSDHDAIGRRTPRVGRAAA